MPKGVLAANSGGKGGEGGRGLGQGKGGCTHRALPTPDAASQVDDRRPGMTPRTPQPQDPAQPLANPRHEAFALALAETGNQSEAYRRAYPQSRRWTEAGLHPQASRLARKVSARVEAIRDASRSERVADLEEAKALVTAFLRDPALSVRERLEAADRLSSWEGWDKARKLQLTTSLPDLLAEIHARRRPDDRG